MRVCSSCGRCFDDAVGFCVEPGHPPLADPLCGGVETIKGYRIEQIVRSERSGAVYRAQHLDSGRPCLIRTVRTDEAGGRQFISEANLASGMYLPGMVDVYEAGQLDAGEYFVVCEEDEGQTVRELLNTVGLPQLLTTIQIVRQAAEALHAIHLKGLVHGAVRPENILLSRDAEHRLLVRIQGLDLGGVEHRSIIGNKFLIDQAVDSIRYFSPEQCVGEAVTSRSDIYSLGIVLYELLAGVPPFEASTAAALIEMHRSKRPADVKIDDFDLRMLLTHTLMESLTKHPDRRQSSANAFARQMRHIEQLATHVSTPPPVVAAPAAPVFKVAASENIVAPRTISSGPVETIGTFSDAFSTDESASAADDGRRAEISVSGSVAVEPPTHFQVIEPVDSLEEQDQQHLPVATATETADQGMHAPPAPASRLRARRRKLHSFITEPPAATASSVIGIDNPTIESEPVAAKQPTAAPASLPQPSVDVPVQPVRRELIKIEWDQPDDDIPSVADVMEVLAREPVNERHPTPVQEPPRIDDQPIARPQPPVQRAPTVIATPIPAPMRKSAAKKPARPAPDRGRRLAKPVAAAKTASHRTQAATSFYPTLLGGLDEKVEYRGSAEPIFAAYGSEPASGMRFPVRSAVIGVGALAIISLSLFGNGPITRYFSTVPSVDSVSARSEPAARPAASEALAQPAPVTIKKEEPAPERKTAETKESRVPARENAPPARVPKKEAPPERKTRPSQPASPRETELPAIIVGRPKVNVTKDDGKRGVKALTGKAAGTTRPRIVKETKQ